MPTAALPWEAGGRPAPGRGQLVRHRRHQRPRRARRGARARSPPARRAPGSSCRSRRARRRRWPRQACPSGGPSGGGLRSRSRGRRLHLADRPPGLRPPPRGGLPRRGRGGRRPARSRARRRRRSSTGRGSGRWSSSSRASATSTSAWRASSTTPSRSSAAEVDRCAGDPARRTWASTSARSCSRPAPRPSGAGERAERRTDLRALLRRGGEPESAASRAARPHRASRSPACFAVEYALARLLMAWGIAPQAMIGYSLGEYVAACLAGVLSLEDALALVARRAKLIQELPAGAMLAVPLAEAEVAAAARRAPRPRRHQRPALLRRRRPRGGGRRARGPARRARGDLPAAAHHPRLPLADDAAGRGRRSPGCAGTVRWGRRRSPTSRTSPAPGSPPPTSGLRLLGATHGQPVRFAEGLAELLREPDRVLVEVGPGGTLSARWCASTPGRRRTARGGDAAAGERGGLGSRPAARRSRPPLGRGRAVDSKRSSPASGGIAYSCRPTPSSASATGSIHRAAA